MHQIPFSHFAGKFGFGSKPFWSQFSALYPVYSEYIDFFNIYSYPCPPARHTLEILRYSHMRLQKQVKTIYWFKIQNWKVCFPPSTNLFASKLYWRRMALSWRHRAGCQEIRVLFLALLQISLGKAINLVEYIFNGGEAQLLFLHS